MTSASTPAPAPASFGLVHGNFLGPWCWENVAATLRSRGAHVAVPDLPSSARDADTTGDLYADAATVRDAVNSVHPPVVLCGHSYGGAVITEVGDHPALRRLVYLAGAVPDIGQSMASLAPDPPAGTPEDAGEQVRTLDDGRIALTPESAAQALFHDCTPAERDRALRHLRPGHPATGGQALTRAAWHTTGATYVRCRHDRMPELVSEAFAATGPPTVELATGHCPNWSAPEDVAALLLTEADRR